MSGIILAGGASRRMGASKAELMLEGKSLIEWQAGKLRALGIEDIMLSGKDCLKLPGTRVIPDIYPDRGPLGGLYSCVSAARYTYCLVLSVDTPLIPIDALARLCLLRTEGGIACLRHAGKPEPLIGVYDTGLKDLIGSLIRDDGAAVRKLEGRVPFTYFDYVGPEEHLVNCNSPEDFEKAKRIVESFKKVN